MNNRKEKTNNTNSACWSCNFKCRKISSIRLCFCSRPSCIGSRERRVDQIQPAVKINEWDDVVNIMAILLFGGTCKEIIEIQLGYYIMQMWSRTGFAQRREDYHEVPIGSGKFGRGCLCWTMLFRIQVCGIVQRKVKQL